MSTRDFSSALGPGQLWRDYMKEALAGTPASDWERPANVVSASVVAAPGAFGGDGSGLLAPGPSPVTTSEWFIKGTAPGQGGHWVVPGCAGAGGTRQEAMEIQERAPAVWQPHT